jgi:hypothetical protein
MIKNLFKRLFKKLRNYRRIIQINSVQKYIFPIKILIPRPMQLKMGG